MVMLQSVPDYRKYDSMGVVWPQNSGSSTTTVASRCAQALRHIMPRRQCTSRRKSSLMTALLRQTTPMESYLTYPARTAPSRLPSRPIQTSRSAGARASVAMAQSCGSRGNTPKARRVGHRQVRRIWESKRRDENLPTKTCPVSHAGNNPNCCVLLSRPCAKQKRLPRYVGMCKQGVTIDCPSTNSNRKYKLSCLSTRVPHVPSNIM